MCRVLSPPADVGGEIISARSLALTRRCRVRLSPRERRRTSLLLVTMALSGLCIGLQLVPLPATLVALLSPDGGSREARKDGEG